MAVIPRSWRYNLFIRLIPRFVLGVIFIYVYCEYLIYYVTQVQCDWPDLTKEVEKNEVPVYAMVIADTHLLGSRHGHWLDKWRREWQMHRAFQTAMTLHKPEVVFVLGDLFDEGKWCSKREFDDYVERFYRLFKVPDGTTLYSVVGNHDIGFHYRITQRLSSRFEDKMDSPPVRLVSIRGNHFVLINSMAMEGDGCTLCARAVKEINRISETRQGWDISSRTNYRPISLATIIAKVLDGLRNDELDKYLKLHDAQFGFRPGLSTESAILTLKQTVEYFTQKKTPVCACFLDLSKAFDLVDILKCSNSSPLCKGNTKLDTYTRPIIMQHYPLYRESDSICTEPDAAPLPERNKLFEERWDCLSKESTEYLIEGLVPRAVFGAHTHHGCVRRHSFRPTNDHKVEFTEYTVPSFSWRNREDPKYYLLTISHEEVKVLKCGMAREKTIAVTAIVMSIALIVYLKYWFNKTRANTFSYQYKLLFGKKV